MTDALPLRSLNPEGIAEVHRLLVEIDAGADPDVGSVINSEDFSEPLGDIHVEVRSFANRLEAGSYFHETLEPLREAGTDVVRHKGLWTWLAMSWLDVLAPREADGTRRLFDHGRWVLAVDDYRAYYRHYLAGPYSVFAAHADNPERAMALLCGPVEIPGEVWEQIASRQDFTSSASLIELATRLYYEPETGRIKKGAASASAGSARRLPKVVMDQFGLTWDVRGMPVEELLALLPGEFDRFR